MSEPIQTKNCSYCKQSKSITKFNKGRTQRDKLQSYCKTCQIISQRDYLKTKKGKEIRHRGNKKYRQTEQGKTTNMTNQKRFRIRHPEYWKANSAVNHAIRGGKLSRPNARLCHYCPKPAQQYHHWHGYAPKHWLDVVPACRDCHTKLRSIT